MMMEMDPAFMGREARLLLMDAQGLEAAILFPTTGVNWEVTMRDAPIDVLYDNLHAFNLWIQDEWGFTHKDRIFAPPILNLSDPDRAAAELEWALNQGTRAIHLRANSPGGRGLVDPVFNPFWSRVNEAGVILSFHISLTEYVKVVGPLWGEKDRDGFPTTGFQWVTMHGERAIIDTLANIILYDMFGKYPNIKVLVAEHGSIWVDYLLKAMDKYRGMGAPAPVRRRPSEVFKEHVYVQPYYTENLMGLVDLIGVDHVLFGSDFPHGESIAAPVDFKNGLEADLTPENLRKVMRENLRGLLLDDP
jgi:predicted TIM-barrel fold metal-dependent hydrolase